MRKTILMSQAVFLLSAGVLLSPLTKQVSSATVEQAMKNQPLALVISSHSFVVEGQSVHGTKQYANDTMLLGGSVTRSEAQSINLLVHPVMTHRPFT